MWADICHWFWLDTTINQYLQTLEVQYTNLHKVCLHCATLLSGFTTTELRVTVCWLCCAGAVQWLIAGVFSLEKVPGAFPSQELNSWKLRGIQEFKGIMICILTVGSQPGKIKQIDWHIKSETVGCFLLNVLHHQCIAPGISWAAPSGFSWQTCKTTSMCSEFF